MLNSTNYFNKIKVSTGFLKCILSHSRMNLITCYAGRSRHKLSSSSIVVLRHLRDSCVILIRAFLMALCWPLNMRRYEHLKTFNLTLLAG